MILYNEIKCELCGTQWRAAYYKSTKTLECPGCSLYAVPKVVKPFTPTKAEKSKINQVVWEEYGKLVFMLSNNFLFLWTILSGIQYLWSPDSFFKWVGFVAHLIFSAVALTTLMGNKNNE